MAAIHCNLSVNDDAILDHVIMELIALANATKSMQQVLYNGKWMKANPNEDPAIVLRNYAGIKAVKATR